MKYSTTAICWQQHATSEEVIVGQDAASQTTMKDPLHYPDYFGVQQLFTMKDLFNARVHLGHKEGSRNEYMNQFIFGNRLGCDIIDLEQTAPLLAEALNFTAHVAYRSGVILFVSRHLQTIPLVEKTAEECGEYAHCREWRRGTFTNSETMFGAVTRLPDILIMLSCHDTVFEQHLCVVEATKLNIPIVGVVDTSCDPRLITYPIPGNDDSLQSIELYCKLFKEAILKGKAKWKEEQNV